MRPLSRFPSILAAAIGLALPPAAHAQPVPKKIGVALYGANGHQIPFAQFERSPHAHLVAVAGSLAPILPDGVQRAASLDELLAHTAVELVTLCSPRRVDQARDAIRCLEAGRHVYAEKPCALTEAELDAILAAAQRSGKEFHEMAGTAFVPHYATMRRLVREGAIGDIVQVLVQKSYRYGASRPQDEAIDGGMFLQAGVHAARMIEHIAGVRITNMSGWETSFGKPSGQEGAGRMAGAAQAALENGGLATVIINYLNPAATALPHGNETLRIFGTKGVIESVDGGARTRLINAGSIVEPFPLDRGLDYFDALAAHLATGEPMPLDPETELHPLRMLLRAKERLARSNLDQGR